MRRATEPLERLGTRGRRAGLALALLAAAGAVPAATAATSASTPATGTWQRLPAAPIAPGDTRIASVWTGHAMLVFGRARRTSGRWVNVAASYEPGPRGWRRLTPPLGPAGAFEGSTSAVWTGTKMLVWGPFTTLSYTPASHLWRVLPSTPTGHAAGLVVWTGHEMIGWGGGCCGDAFSDGAAYTPQTDSWRTLAPSPLPAGGQDPEGAWTGKELIVFGVRNPEGPQLRNAAAYDPATGTWRTIAPLPAPRYGATTVWDGHELLVVGGVGVHSPALARVAFAYSPKTNVWRRLPALRKGRAGAAAVWTGSRLLVWGGQTALMGPTTTPRRVLAYSPATDRWSRLAQAPLEGHVGPAAVWTGREMLVWGGFAPAPFRILIDGAAFRPPTR